MEERRERAPRLHQFDYRTARTYFVTLCMHRRRPILSRIRDAKTHLTPIGAMVDAT